MTTVWKWIAPSARWAFYAPSLAGQALADYAAGKGYDVLTTVAGGEGFWVNAKQAFNAAVAGGDAVTVAAVKAALRTGWNLVALGETKTPRQFNDGLSDTPPQPGTVPANVTTLWAWDNPQAKWYFYAPSLEAQGGTKLADYISGKGYLDFALTGKTLGSGVGFWVNKP